MAKSIYERGADVSNRLLDKKKMGQGTVVLSKQVAGTAPANPWEPVTTTTQQEEIKAAVNGINKRLYGTAIGSTVLMIGDREVICAPPKMSYSAGDSIIVDGNVTTILSVENKPAAGIRSAVKFFIRG